MTNNLPSNQASRTPAAGPEQRVLVNGVSAETGEPLRDLTPSSLALLARVEAGGDELRRLARTKHEEATKVHYGTVWEVAPNDLSQAGWGVVFHSAARPEVKEALEPLIEHRRRQAGSLCRVFENGDGYQTGQSCAEWLARHGASLMTVEPRNGVPFYLLLVGSPEEIPFQFQYLLDVYWGVGRLHFDEPADYRRYAESVVAYEQESKVRNSRSAVTFATRHDFDAATQMFASEVALPLAHGDDKRGPLGEQQKYHRHTLVGGQATKESLTRLLRGELAGGPPSLLFTGSHGMSFRDDDRRQAETQGALVCQEWAGYGGISAGEWFSAHDLPRDAQVHGLIHFFFACYGAGWPQFDDYADPSAAQARQIARAPGLARLPQKLLSHPNGGALAALGHVDRAWSHSFRSARVGPQVQGFRDVIGRILRGDRLGLATDQFDVMRAALSLELTDVLREVERGNERVTDKQVASLWVARNDARNYVVLGDPAVRLRVEDLNEVHAGDKLWASPRATVTGDGGGEPRTLKAGAQSDAAAAAGSEHTRGGAAPSPTPEVDGEVGPAKSFDRGNQPGSPTFGPALTEEWGEHVKRAYVRNELMFDRLLRGFMQPYRTTLWAYRILLAVGVAGFVAAVILGAWKGAEFGALFGGLSVVSLLGYFIGRPLRSLERNIFFITWLGLIYNTYWTRLARVLKEPTALRDIAALQEEATADLERLIRKHQQVTTGAARAPAGGEDEAATPHAVGRGHAHVGDGSGRI